MTNHNICYWAHENCLSSITGLVGRER